MSNYDEPGLVVVSLYEEFDSDCAWGPELWEDRLDLADAFRREDEDSLMVAGWGLGCCNAL